MARLGNQQEINMNRNSKHLNLVSCFRRCVKSKNDTRTTAKKCGTTKTYISRIENDASDIRLSTLMRIIQEGLGGRLRLSVDI
jgi:transcriptional regulator with XRE-family HTH domain